MKFELIHFMSIIMVIKLATLNDYTKEYINMLKDQASSKSRKSQRNSAAYFSGREIIRYKNVSLNFTDITIELRLQFEGGQFETAPVLRLYDSCTYQSPVELIIGLTTRDEGHDMQFYYSLKSNENQNECTLFSHQHLAPLKWYDITVTFDGEKMMLFVDKAKVAVSKTHRGSFFRNLYANCVTMDIGGDCNSKKTFRGSVTSVNIWNTAKSHKNLARKSVIERAKNLQFVEKFITKRFENIGFFSPEVTPLKEKNLEIDINIPACGLTVCDNPEIIKSYSKDNNHLLYVKSIRYRLLNLMNDDYTNPMFDNELILKNNKLLNEIFRAYNITFVLHQVKINNTYLRNKTIVIDCYGHCEGDALSHCNVESKPNDCAKQCSIKDIGNGICNPECNKPTQYTAEGFVIGLDYQWDGGDCCLSEKNVSKTCYDYNSPKRAFLQENELKNFVNLKNDHFLNIFPVNIKPNVLGKSTFPWDPKRYETQGGILTNADQFRNGMIIDLIHEIGHAFGLWHVHKGVSELSECSDECAEIYPSMTLGDLCSDTNPTPGNPLCEESVVNGKCNMRQYTKVPYNNFMGYTSGNCTNRFTRQQMSRMHCYIDKYYQRWSENIQPPSKIPLPPRVVSIQGDEVGVTWIEPIGKGSNSAKNKCSLCTNSQELKQYAFRSWSPTDAEKYKTRSFRKHLSMQFLGLPDVQHKCQADNNAWMPQVKCSGYCYVDAYFKLKIIPKYLTIWVTYQSGHTIYDIQLITVKNESLSVGGAMTQCDVPYTRQLHTKKYIKAIRIYVTSSMVGLDAVMIQSIANHSSCKICKELTLVYRVYRQPMFDNSTYVVTHKTFFKDHVLSNITYYYWVVAFSKNHHSAVSSPLIFRASDGFCGNGKIERYLGEECDDGNIRNGDGCNVECEEERVFNCKREPSLCYRHDRDQTCEDFERKTNTKDCGFFTPDGFIDHWAINVTGPKDQSNDKCQEEKIEGPPQRYLKCVGTFEEISGKAWRPCKRKFSRKRRIYTYNLYLAFPYKVHPKAVVIYLLSDGSTVYGKSYLNVSVTDASSSKYIPMDNPFEVSCGHNPLILPMGKGLQNIKTKHINISFSVKYWRIAISAIALRSAKGFCGENNIYNIQLDKCLPANGSSHSCPNLKINNASYSCENTDNNIHICNITCDHGFEPVKAFTVYCLHGFWRNLIRCKPRDCGAPKLVNAKLNECNQTTVGSTCHFECSKNSTFSGSTKELFCNAIGYWEIGGSCYKRCSKTIHVGMDLKIELQNFSSCFKHALADDFSMGTWCRLSCPPGFKVSPKDSELRLFDGNNINAYCDSDGKWRTDSLCTKIKCRELTMYESLLYTCTNENFFKSKCSTNCFSSEAKPYHVECLSDGRWSRNLDVCTRQARCLPPLNNGSNMDFSSCSANFTGSECRPFCVSHGQRSNNLDIVIKGKEENSNQVKLYCMPNGKWLPPIENLYCIKSCVLEDMGNDWCDCHNNNKHCKYDGGDCCPYIPLNSCPCIDPNHKTQSAVKGEDEKLEELSGETPGEMDDTEEGDDDDDDDGY